ncbi:MAG: hypothetical protein LBP78_01055 [Acidaminococcales bacterium]|jgi:hypothetical protein|nr:hypothetical protein [Acidaminococcales bacterium]
MELKVRQTRTENRWALGFAASMVGVASQAASNIRTGKRKPPCGAVCKPESFFGKPHPCLLRQAQKESECPPSKERTCLAGWGQPGEIDSPPFMGLAMRSFSGTVIFKQVSAAS